MSVLIWVYLLESLHSMCSLWQLAAVILAIWSVGLCKRGYNTDSSLICMTVENSWHKPEEGIQRSQEAGWFIEFIYASCWPSQYYIPWKGPKFTSFTKAKGQLMREMPKSLKSTLLTVLCKPGMVVDGSTIEIDSHLKDDRRILGW